jgi:peptide chain release factor 2
LFEDWLTLIEFSEEGDEDSGRESLVVFEKLCSFFARMEKQLLFSEEVDPNNAIVSINAGAGGTESCDWAEMLYRMILRWAESKKFKVSLVDLQPGDGAGIKSTTFMVEGDYAYGLLKSETGVHRLVRISPFDSSARRHTSFASIFVSAEIDENIEIDIQDICRANHSSPHGNCRNLSE